MAASCCAAVAELTDDAALRRSVQNFDATVLRSQATEMRDIWEHFDEYVIGCGRLQLGRCGRAHRGAQHTLGTYIWTGQAEHLGSLTWAGLTINFDAAVAGAQRLYGDLRESRFRPETDQE